MSRYPKINLDGALVAITGGARGIGLATARAFVAKGARVAIGDLDAELAEKAATELGAGVTAHRLDVTDKASFAAFVAAAEEAHGRPLDVLVNNAGIMPNGAFLEGSERIDRMQFDVNVHGTIHGLRIVLPGMIERGRGHVVNVASLAGKFPLKGLAVYNASKFAAVGLTAAVRLETADTGVSVRRSCRTPCAPSSAPASTSASCRRSTPRTSRTRSWRRVKSRAAEIAVPSYVGFATKAVPFVPERVFQVARKLVHDDAAINRVDDEVRRRYLDRVENQ
jgi:NADP-dependent 3-hydroxy acid dehydrogenase YdfG